MAESRLRELILEMKAMNCSADVAASAAARIVAAEILAGAIAEIGASIGLMDGDSPEVRDALGLDDDDDDDEEDCA